MSSKLIARVAVEKAAYSFDKEFSYLVPDAFAACCAVGKRVLVPFGRGNSRRQGIVTGLAKAENTEGFKELLSVLDEEPVHYVCNCSRERLERYFCTMSDEDIRSMADEKGVAVANCHFCNKKYIFTKEDLEKLIAEKNS